MNGQVEGPGTMPSARRRKGKAPKNEDEPLGPLPSSVAIEPELPPESHHRPVPARHAVERPWHEAAPVWPPASAARAPELIRPPPPPPQALAPAPVVARAVPVQARRATAPAGATARGPQLFAVPTKGGRGKPRIYFELYWQGARQMAKSFGPTSKKKPITSGLADVAMVPFYGFTMPEGFPLAESAGRGSYRLYLPPKAELEKRRSDGRFVSAATGDVEAYDGRKCVLLQSGNAIALREGDMTCFVYVAPPPERTFVNPFRNRPWFFIFLLLAFFGPTTWWILFGPQAAGAGGLQRAKPQPGRRASDGSEEGREEERGAKERGEEGREGREEGREEARKEEGT